ncbi:MAG: DUF4097 family beta strand repeat-containing protein [Bacillota bacterium]
MSSRWIKALAVVAIVWCVLMVGQAVVANIGLNWLSHMFDFGGMIGQAKATRETSDSFSSSDVDSVLVQSENGSIVVAGTDDDQITLTAKFSARAGTQAAADQALAKMQSRNTIENRNLQIIADYGRSQKNGLQISYELSVPHRMLLRANTSNGNIDVHGVQGQLILKTSNGSIEVRSEAELGDVNASTSNGNVDILFGTGQANIHATTSNGSVYVTGQPSGGTCTLRSSNGNVEAVFPESLGVELDASVGNGTLDIGEGQWTIVGGKISSKNIQATRGDGALRLDISTGNGKVIVGRK